MKYYTIGEIYRYGLLKNHKGEPYKSKAAVSVAARALKKKITKTVFGTAHLISHEEIVRFNRKHI